MIVQLTRFVLAAAGALAGLQVNGLIDWTKQYGFPESLVIILFVILGASIGFIFGGIIGRELQRGFIYLEDYLRSLSASDLILGAIGLFVGLGIAVIVTVPIRLLEPTSVALGGSIVAYIVLGYYGIRIVMLKRRDFARLFPKLAEAAPAAAAAVKVLDTSAVIDGRFAELMRAGFVTGSVRVPGFVLSELQTLSDSADDLKRARGRRGLDLLATMRSGNRPVEVFDADYPEIPTVDGKLVQLARDAGAQLVTVDYNLSQVARVQGADVLNINDIVAALRPTHLPGEPIRVHVTREGKEAEQGVGYLEDGTMVVVQGGRDLIGQEVDSTVTSVLQTAGGRMVFVRPKVAP